MKRYIFFIYCLMFLLVTSCASVPISDTPEQRYKKDIALVLEENKNLEGYVTVDKLTKGQIHDKWGNATVSMKINIPEVSRIPVHICTPEIFSVSFIEKTIKSMAGEDVTFYEIGQPSIEYYKEYLASIYDTIESYEEWKKEVTDPPEVLEGYNAATGETEYLVIDEAFINSEIKIAEQVAREYIDLIEGYQDQDREEIELHYSTDEKDLYSEETEVLRASFDYNDNNYIVYTLFGGKMLVIGKRDYGSIDEGAPTWSTPLFDDGSYVKKIGIQKKEAEEIGKRFMKAVDSQMELRTSYPAVEYTDGETEEFVWKLYFTRKIDGIDITFEDHEIDDSLINRPPVRYETLEVDVDKTGIVGMRWIFPHTYKKILAEDVKLMPTESVLGIAKDYLSIQEYEDFKIAEMKLSYMRVDKQNDIDNFYNIPVWDFFGSASQGFDFLIDFSSYSFLTINALDGTIIDRSLGY